LTDVEYLFVNLYRTIRRHIPGN